jgi:hypothetical protein
LAKSGTVRNSFDFMASIDFCLIVRVSRLLFSILLALSFAFHAFLLQVWLQNFVTVVRAVNDLLHCWQILSIAMFELI